MRFWLLAQSPTLVASMQRLRFQRSSKTQIDVNYSSSCGQMMATTACPHGSSSISVSLAFQFPSSARIPRICQWFERVPLGFEMLNDPENIFCSDLS